MPASHFAWDAQQGQLVVQHPQDLQVSVLHPVAQQDFGQHAGGQHTSLLTFSGTLQQQVVILIDILVVVDVQMVESVGGVERSKNCF